VNIVQKRSKEQAGRQKWGVTQQKGDNQRENGKAVQAAEIAEMLSYSSIGHVTVSTTCS